MTTNCSNFNNKSGQWRSFSKITTEVSTFRNATILDVPLLNKINQEENQIFFGIPNFQHYIEYAVYQKILEDDNKNIVGFIVINNYPHIKALSPSNWVEWMKYHYQLPSIDYTNTLFIEYMILDYLCDPYMFRRVFKDIFLKYPKLKYICSVSPPKTYGDYDEIIGLYGEKCIPINVHENQLHQYIYIAHRHKYISQLKFRKAMAADNDELVEMLDQKYPENRKNFGDFYIAEEMLHGDSTTRTIIVMERNDKNLGVMFLNSEVNAKFLNENFDLSIYDNLKRRSLTCSETKFTQKSDVVRQKSEEFFKSLSQLVTDDATLYLPDKFRSELLSIQNLLGSFAIPYKESHDELDIQLHSQIFEQSDDVLYRPVDIQNIKLINTMSNVFALEFFGLISTIDPRRIYELLVAAFSNYPDKEYCLYLIDTNESLDHLLTFFTRVPPRPECASNQCLYITHRNVVIGNLRIYLTDFDDFVAIQEFLDTENPDRPMKLSDEVMGLIWNSLLDIYTTNKSICITSNNNLVGIAVLSGEKRYCSLKKYYILDDFVDNTIITDEAVQGRLIYCYINPIFDSESAYIFSEMTRLTGFQNIFYSLEVDPESNILNLYNNLLPEMFPVLPAEIYEIPYKVVTGFTDDKPECEPLEPFPLYFQSIKLSQEPRKNIDTKIVTIGFDDVCKGFLIQLIFGKQCRNYKFTSITILNDVEHISLLNMEQIKLFLNWKLVLGYDYLKRLGLHVWYNVISLDIQNISRMTKTITFFNKQSIKYDKLFLLCSVDYGFPSNLPFKSCVIPANYVILNSPSDAAVINNKIRILHKVYPKGINGSNIHFVVQSKIRNDEVNVGAFDDDTIQDEMIDILRKANCNIYENYRFYRWKVDSGFIVSITFESKLKFLTLPCKILVNCNRKMLFRKMTTLFNQAGLVMDSRLIIDKNFKLNDPHIYSAGPITQYKRILFGSKYDHLHYSKSEIGKMLGQKFFNELYDKKDKKYAKIPIPAKPLITQVFLPGGYLYMSIKRPGLRLPNKIAKLLSNYGTILATGSKEPDGSYKRFTGKRAKKEELPYSDYFKMRMDDKGYIDSLVCLTRRTEQPLHHLIALFEFNEKMLNNLRKRYELGQINDFLEFFCQSWVKDLLNNNFHKVLNENEAYLRSIIENDTFSNSLLNKNAKGHEKIITDNDRKSLKNTLTKEETVKYLEDSIENFKK